MISFSRNVVFRDCRSARESPLARVSRAPRVRPDANLKFASLLIRLRRAEGVVEDTMERNTDELWLGERRRARDFAGDTRAALLIV